LPSPIRHLGELIANAATKRSRELADAEALAHLESRALAVPRGLEVEWLGVAGFALTAEGETLLIDPYFSRVPLRTLLRREPALPDPQLIDRHLPRIARVAGIVIGHTHWDHAVDAPALARRFGCPVLGSRSLVNLMGLHGLEQQAVEVEPHKPYELGPFTVRCVPSRHSRLLLGLAVPYAGELTCEQLDGLCPSAYRCGQVWGIDIEVAGTRLYHQGSADLIEEEMRRPGVDVFLAGVAGRNFTRDYFARVLRMLQPRVVVPNHYDNFFRPLSAAMAIPAAVGFHAVPDEVAAVSRDIEVVALPYPRVAASSS
jgi:L-ascorbate metabolism protein UlaG (beta-lactamase superfamily)